MGMGLDPVTFPGMGSLKGKDVLETAKIAIFSLQSNYKYFFPYLSLLFS